MSKTYETFEDFVSFLWERCPTEEDLNVIRFLASDLMDSVAIPVSHAEIEEAYQELLLDL